jgi:hypothetical protein
MQPPEGRRAQHTELRMTNRETRGTEKVSYFFAEVARWSEPAVGSFSQRHVLPVTYREWMSHLA